MAPGPSSIISKAVVEVFARTFLRRPAVIWLSESRDKVVARDDELARRIGLTIQPDQILPDIILVDLDAPVPLLVFVEAVASDGPITDLRKAALTKLATDSNYHPKHIAFVTAYTDRDAAYRKTSSEIAWKTFVWIACEPDAIVIYRGASTSKTFLSDLIYREAVVGRVRLCHAMYQIRLTIRRRRYTDTRLQPPSHW